jgi:hypothetical protein
LRETANVAKRGAKAKFAAAAGAELRADVLKQGSDLGIAKKALEDATSLARGLWLSFITFGT